MRDLVDRIWSTARMRRRVHHLRTRYDSIIRNVEAGFDTHQVRFAFYETMFSRSRIRSVTDFLTLPFVETDLGSRHKASPKFEKLDESLQREVAEAYRPVYEFCAAKFGLETLDRLWPSYRILAPRSTRRAA